MPHFDSMTAFRDDGLLNVVVESPRGSTMKVKFDAASGLMMLSRPLPAGLAYPFDWGFVAGTRAADGDALDAMIVWDCTSYPGLLVPARLLGVLRVEQTSRSTGRRERNDRTLVVPGTAARFGDLRSVEDVPKRTLAELEQFFTAAVAFEGKELALLGWGDAEEAHAIVRTSARETAQRNG